MAQKHRSRRRSTGKSKRPTSSAGRFLMIGVIVLIVGLLGFGTFQLLGGQSGQQASGISIAQAETGSEADVSAVPADRETRYLGPASDPATVTLAEAGELDKPTLVWFHADWCHVCQQIKPDVVDMGEAFQGQVKFVRLDVDHSESRSALQRYGVRATPTFVLLDAEGNVRGNVPGWPGRQALATAFEQLSDEG